MMASGAGGVDNPMNPNLYTEKAWDAVAKLPQYADKYSTQYVEASLLMRALMEEGPAGLFQRILFKAGVDTKTFDKNLEEFLKKQPRTSDTSQKQMGKTMEQCLNKAGSFRC